MPFCEIWHLFSLAPMRNFLWCYYRWLITSLALEKCKKNAICFKLFWCKVFVHSKNYGQNITTFRPIFGHFQVSKKLKELAYICVRCKNMLRTIKNIPFWLCEWNPTAFNQQRWYPSLIPTMFLPCLPMYLWMKPYSYSLIWLHEQLVQWNVRNSSQ